jgi:polar amino acid transport system substrate-binding protein
VFFSCLAIVFLGLLKTQVQAQELVIAYGEGKPPFVYSAEGKWQGFEIDLVTQILEEKGHKVIENVHLPDKRLDTAIQKMQVDGVISIKAKDNELYFSKDVIAFKNYAISLKEDKLSIKTVADLAKYSVVAWYGASVFMGETYKKLFSKQAVAKRKGEYEEYPNQNVQNVVFWYKRAQVIVIDKSIFLWNKKELKNQYDTTVELVYHDIFPQTNAYQAGFKDRQIRDDFNKGLQEFKDSGRYQALMDKHTL